jgi:hypothetical protein
MKNILKRVENMSEQKTIYKRKIIEETPIGYIDEGIATCPSCGGKLEKKGDEYKCPYCKKIVRHDLVLFDDSGKKIVRVSKEDLEKFEKRIKKLTISEFADFCFRFLDREYFSKLGKGELTLEYTQLKSFELKTCEEGEKIYEPLIKVMPHFTRTLETPITTETTSSFGKKVSTTEINKETEKVELEDQTHFIYCGSKIKINKDLIELLISKAKEEDAEYINVFSIMGFDKDVLEMEEEYETLRLFDIDKMGNISTKFNIGLKTVNPVIEDVLESTQISAGISKKSAYLIAAIICSVLVFSPLVFITLPAAIVLWVLYSKAKKGDSKCRKS